MRSESSYLSDERRASLLCAAPALLFVTSFVVISPLQYWTARSTAVAPVVDPGQIRDTAAGALQNYELLCREAGVRATKVQGKHIAEQVPNTALADQFAQQIDEAEANMNDFAGAYGRSVGRLAQADERVVAGALRAEATDSRSAAYVDVIANDAQKARAQPLHFAASGMSATCARLANNAP